MPIESQPEADECPFNQEFDGAFNKHDATAVGALYTANAVQTTPAGSFSGREASKLSVGGTAAV